MRKNKLKMLIAIGAFIIAMTGCKKTPTEKAVIEKDTDKMIAKASENNGKNEQKNKEVVPMDKKEYKTYPYKEHLTNKENNLIVNIDVKAKLVQNTGFPITRVEKRTFNQKEVDNMVNTLIGSEKFFKIPTVLTKEMIQDEIIELKKYHKMDDERGFSSNEFKTVGKEIKYLKKMLDHAPEQDSEEEASRQLVSYRNGTRVAGYTKEKDGRKKYLFIENNCEEGLVTMQYSNFPNKDVTTYNYEGSNSTIPVNSMNKPKISKEDATKKAEELLDQMHINDNNEFGVYETSMASAINKLNEKEDNFVWMVIFTRQYNGVPSNMGIHGDNNTTVRNDLQLSACQYLTDEDAKRNPAKQQNRDAEFSAPWNEELISVLVDDSGIIGMHWETPYEVKETPVEDSKIMDFNNVKKIANKMLLVQDANLPKSLGRKSTKNCNQMNFEYQLIKEKNKKGNALIVPVWRISGIEKNEDKGGNKQEINEYTSDFIIINAIDGTVVTENRGTDGGIG